MFDKLFGVINKIEAEPSKAPAAKPDHTKGPINQSTRGIDKGTLIGYDYLKKSDIGSEERIQQKMELLKQLQKELGKYNE